LSAEIEVLGKDLAKVERSVKAVQASGGHGTRQDVFDAATSLFIKKYAACFSCLAVMLFDSPCTHGQIPAGA
jgi:hypothetical protein